MVMVHRLIALVVILGGLLAGERLATAKNNDPDQQPADSAVTTDDKDVNANRENHGAEQGATREKTGKMTAQETKAKDAAQSKAITNKRMEAVRTKRHVSADSTLDFPSDI